MPRVRVILAAHGEAASRSWWEHFRVGQRTLGHAAEVIRLPLPLRLLICALGATRKCLSRHGRSPHNALSRQQASALAAELGPGFEVEAAFLASPPLLPRVLAQPGESNRQLVCSMMPTDSRLACGQLCRAIGALPADAPPAAVLARLWDDPAFIEVNLEHVLAQAPPAADLAQPAALVLALHGTLLRDRRGVAPGFHTGQWEKERFAVALREALLGAAELPWQRVEIAYLNHGVGGDWSEPSVEHLLQVLGREGVACAHVFPCDYLVEGGETADGLAATLAAAPLSRCERLPCLNAAPVFIRFLAQRIRRVMRGDAAHTRCDHCPLDQSNTRGQA